MHFLARNNVPVKELYEKMIKFSSDEIDVPMIEQYLKTCPKMLPMTHLILVIL